MSKIFLLALLVLWSVPCGAQTPKLEDLRVSFASFGVIYDPHFIAKMPDHYLWMCFFKDPDGHTFALMEEKRR